VRETSITIGGKEYPAQGLTVIQSLKEDIVAAEVNKSDDADIKATARMRRMALALQNAKAFLPDPKNPNGEIQSADLKVEQVIVILNSGIFTDMEEFYEAELAILKLMRPKLAAQLAPKEMAPAAGELQATG